MTKYNHAYTLAFSLVNRNAEGEASDAEITIALLQRIALLLEAGQLQEAVGPPFDSYEEVVSEHCPTCLGKRPK